VLRSLISIFKEEFGSFLFGGRWILAWLYVGLQVSMILYAYKYTILLIALCKDVVKSPEEMFMLSVLGLVDITMVANLIEMIKSGSYTIFVRRFHIADAEERPQWLDDMTAGLQKVKMSASILGISSVHLLRDFIDAEHVTSQTIHTHVLIHLVILCSTLGLALTEKLTHEKHTSPDHS